MSIFLLNKESVAKEAHAFAEEAKPFRAKGKHMCSETERLWFQGHLYSSDE